jgi:hypothetical protein
VPCRFERQRREILRSIADQQLHHAADLAHEHLVEFPDDELVRLTLVAALEASTDVRLRRRVAEFRAP